MKTFKSFFKIFFFLSQRKERKKCSEEEPPGLQLLELPPELQSELIVLFLQRQYTVRRQIMLVAEQKQCDDCFYNWKWADCLIPFSLVTLQLRLIGGTHKNSHSCIETSWLEYCMLWHCNPIYFLRKEMISDYQLLPLAFPASTHFPRGICEWKTQRWNCYLLELAVVTPGVSTGWRWGRIQECRKYAQGSIQFLFGIGSQDANFVICWKWNKLHQVRCNKNKVAYGYKKNTL